MRYAPAVDTVLFHLCHAAQALAADVADRITEAQQTAWDNALFHVQEALAGFGIDLDLPEQPEGGA